MSLVHDLMENSLVLAIGWVLLHSLWQGLLIGAGFWICRAAWRESAKARYAAGCLALLLMLVLPLLTVWSSSRPFLSMDSGSVSSHQVGAAFGWSAGATATSPLPSGVRSLFYSLAEFLQRLAPFLAGLWILGVAVFSMRLLRDYFWVRQIRSQSLQRVDSRWEEILNDLRCRLRIDRTVRLMKSALVEVPTVIGWLRPVILLPAASFIGLTPGQLETILVHELAHVRRLDYVVNVLQCVLETLLFYHPVMWWISRCVREERENCCDDLVIEICQSRLEYARALAALEQSRAAPVQWAFAATGGSLIHRIQRLIGGSADRPPLAARQAAGLAMIGLGLLFIALGVFLALGRPVYWATARVKVEHNLSLQLKSSDGASGVSLYDPYFFQTQFEIIKSEFVLQRVIDALQLTTAWGKRYAGGRQLTIPETLAMLRERLDLRPVRSTDLIEIRVSGEVPGETDVTANAVADSYATYRREELQKQGSLALEPLRNYYDQQDMKLRQAMNELDLLRKNLKVPDSILNESSPMNVNVNSIERFRRFESLRIERVPELAREEALLGELKKLSYKNLVQSLPTAVPDTLLNSLLEQNALAEQILLAAEKDYGPEHPETVKAKARVEDLRGKIKDRVDGIMLGLSKRVEAMQAGMKKFEAEMNETVASEISREEQFRPYFDKKRELEDLTRFRQVLGMKIAQESVDVNLPKSPPVLMVDKAVQPLRPIAPNRPRAAAVILFGLFLNLGGLLMLRGSKPAKRTL